MRILDTYTAELKRLRDGIIVTGATAEEVVRVQRHALDNFGVQVDSEYLELSRFADGVGARGTYLYSVAPRTLVSPLTGRVETGHWIIEQNQSWRNTDPTK